MSKIIYQIQGKELANLKQQVAALVNAQNNFFAIIQFIAQREGLDLTKVQFNQNDLSFVEISEQTKE